MRVARRDLLSIAELGPPLDVEAEQQTDLLAGQPGLAVPSGVHVDAERAAGRRAGDEARHGELATSEVARAVRGAQLEDASGQGRARSVGEQPPHHRLLARRASRPPEPDAQVPGYARWRLDQQAGRENIGSR